LRFDRDEALFKEGLLIELTYKISKSNAEDLTRRVELEKERLKIRKDAVEAQLAVSQASIDKLKAMLELKRSQVDQLKVRAGVVGVLQELPGPTPNTQLQEGQRLSVGSVIAKVAEPRKLKAELKIPETRIKDIAFGQLAQIDTRNGIIPGRVSRIDPAAKEGTILVDVKLEGPLPAAARPDLSVDGTIEIEKLADVLFVGRPAFGQPNSTVSMFKIDSDEKGADRVQVKFGRTSVTTIEIVEGLKAGDKVILSDMSTWDSYERVQLKK
jgi:HlyD family secretion protein